MKLTFDLPVRYNDVSDSDIGQLYVQVKKLVDDLNYILSNISEDNLSVALKNKLKSTSESAQKALTDAQKALDAIDEMKEGE